MSFHEVLHFSKLSLGNPLPVSFEDLSHTGDDHIGNFLHVGNQKIFAVLVKKLDWIDDLMFEEILT